MSPAEIVRLLGSRPLPLSNEKDLQAEISKLFDAEGVLHKREVTLSPGNVIDFMLEDGLGIEVKLKQAKREIYRQCERYCGHPQVKSLILLTATATGFPPDIGGKPCYVVSLGRGWL